jgi:hypothetical protein
MSALRRAFSPVKAYLDRQLEERLNSLSGQVEDVRQIAVETRRLVVDQLDSSTEAAALLGRSIEELRAAVYDLQQQLAAARPKAKRDGSAPAAS